MMTPFSDDIRKDNDKKYSQHIINDNFPTCNHEEADTRLFLHAKDQINVSKR